MSEKKIIEKKWLNLIKMETQKSNWKFKQYFIFKNEGILLFSSKFWVNGKNNSLHGVLTFKHKDIDDLFWELTDSLNLKNYPLSLKVEGNHVVFPISYFQYKLTDITEDNIRLLLKSIYDKVIEIKNMYTDKEKFYSYIKQEKKFNEYGYLTNLLYLKKYKELVDFIIYCKKNNITSGISFYKGDILESTYFDRILNYIHTNNLLDENGSS